MKTATAVATKQSEGDSDKTVTKNIEIFYENIPIKTVEQLEEIERWLDNKENCMAVVRELSRIGGINLGQTVRKILYRVLSNEMANTFSWDGMKQKNAFKNLNSARAILEAVKMCYPLSKEIDIILVIKSWLVKAKERLKMKDGKEHEEAREEVINE
ncbi:unnamed protein product [Psylliodes chrysocephalus]|uniref:DUF4806 domain-containing protein n=1 Tax=Psylliodes chrysocephalus TaxID=3402493 RepID=A0A9P0CMV5_9CUCU|nr:unnamed protein product [Psylliodes chrysocephala]